MAIEFIHTGDWHLAKPFGRFDLEKAALLREARARVVDRVGDLARQIGASVVLVAGDVFDGPLVADAVLRKLAARLEQFSDLQWHFLPGNHDPATSNSVWSRFAAMCTVDHVVIHQEAGLHHISTGIDLLTAPLHARAIAHDPTAWMVDGTSTPDTIRIGLAHGAVQGFGSAGEASVLISPDRAVSAELDYLALGDWHGVRQVGPKAWYAGTPEPDQFPDNDPGYALSVSIARHGAEPQVQRHWLGQYEWRKSMLDGDLLARLGDLERSLVATGTDATNTLLRLDIQGRVTLEEEFELRDRIERLSDRTFHTEADFSQVTVNTQQLDADAFDDPLLASVAAQLTGVLTAGGDEGAIAHRALLLLARLAREQENVA
ncbi:MAG: DNA repair exonuclease SbcCD nuclease subunit [Hyphomicrobiaceae bacterium]|jgi:DNA repair exonuclease SbcCD nuclease subunit